MHSAALAAGLPLLFAVTSGAPTSDPAAPLPAAEDLPPKRPWEQCGNWTDLDDKPQPIPAPTCAELHYKLLWDLHLDPPKRDNRHHHHHPSLGARGAKLSLPPDADLLKVPEDIYCGHWTTPWREQRAIPRYVCYDLTGIEPERVAEPPVPWDIRKIHRRSPVTPPLNPSVSEDNASPENKHEPDQVQHKQDAASPKADPHHGWVVTKTRHCGNWTDDHGASHEITSDDCEMMQEDLDEAEEEPCRITAASLAVLLPPQADDDEAAKEGAAEQ